MHVATPPLLTTTTTMAMTDDGQILCAVLGRRRAAGETRAGPVAPDYHDQHGHGHDEPRVTMGGPSNYYYHSEPENRHTRTLGRQPSASTLR